MFLRSVVLGSAVIVAFASSVEHVADDQDANSKVRGATLDEISECPPTEARTFHHDGLHKDQRAEATFHFDPPRDGCYLIEERTELDAIPWSAWKKCEASANTKVHVHYGNGKGCKAVHTKENVKCEAVGTVDQTPKAFGRQPQDRWTFIAALQFYKGHPGNVTLSNEGTEEGTLTVFDQIRFAWSGNDCFETHAHPRRAEIRMTVDFTNIAGRLTVFGIAFKKRLADMAGVPENSLRLTDLRPGSKSFVDTIVELLVLPSVVDDLQVPHYIELIRSAVSKKLNAAELCALTAAPLEGCNIELEDLGFAMPSVQALHPEQRTQQQQEADTQAEGTANVNIVIIVVCAVAAAGLLLFALYRLYKARSFKTKTAASKSSVQSMEKQKFTDFQSA